MRMYEDSISEEAFGPSKWQLLRKFALFDISSVNSLSCFCFNIWFIGEPNPALLVLFEIESGRQCFIASLSIRFVNPFPNVDLVGKLNEKVISLQSRKGDLTSIPFAIGILS